MLIHVQLVVTAVSYKNVVVVSLVGFAKISISISWGCTILQIFMKKNCDNYADYVQLNSRVNIAMVHFNCFAFIHHFTNKFPYVKT